MFSVFVLDCGFPDAYEPGSSCVRFDNLALKEVLEMVRFCEKHNKGNDLVIRPYLDAEEGEETGCQDGG